MIITGTTVVIQKCFCIPDRYICRKAVTSIVHPRTYIALNTVYPRIFPTSAPISVIDNRKCTYNAEINSRLVYPDARSVPITPASFLNRITDRNTKYKCKNRHYNIKQHNDHRTVASHIIPCKMDRLILILWYKTFYRHDILPCLPSDLRPSSFLFSLLQVFYHRSRHNYTVRFT